MHPKDLNVWERLHKARGLFNKHYSNPKYRDLAFRLREIMKNRAHYGTPEEPDFPDPDYSPELEKKVRLLRRIVRKSDDFKKPLGKISRRIFQHLISTTSDKAGSNLFGRETPSDLEKLKAHSDALSSMSSKDEPSLFHRVTKGPEGSYLVKDKHGDTYKLYKKWRHSDGVKNSWEVPHDKWGLKHVKTGDEVGSFKVVGPDNEMKGTFFDDSAYKGKGLAPVAYMALAKHYGGLESDKEITLKPGKGIWKSLRRRGLANIEPIKGKESRTTRDWWEDAISDEDKEPTNEPKYLDYPEGPKKLKPIGNQRYKLIKHPEISKNVEKLQQLRKSKKDEPLESKFNVQGVARKLKSIKKSQNLGAMNKLRARLASNLRDPRWVRTPLSVDRQVSNLKKIAR